MIRFSSKRNIIIILTMIIIISIIIFLVLLSKDNTNIISEQQNIILIQNENTLNIERNSTISTYFPDNISEIKLVNYLSDSENPTTYIIRDIESMKEFISLLTTTTWNEDDLSRFDNNLSIVWRITITGSTTTTLEMLGTIGHTNGIFGIVRIITDNVSQIYKIPEGKYLEILAYSNEKYYLHDSKLEIPTQSKCYAAQKATFINLSEDEQKKLKNDISGIHFTIEDLLLISVKILKDSSSPYWLKYTTPGIFEEPLDNNVKVQSDGGFSKVLKETQEIKKLVKNEVAQNDFEIVCILLQEGINEHNISKLFEAHKIIHDYDYWVISTPLHLDYTPPDWSGVDTYFGKASVFQNMK